MCYPSPVLYRALIRPLLFRLDPETAHHHVMALLRFFEAWHGGARAWRRLFGPRGARSVDVLGMRFPSVLGVAAGFDKDARSLWGAYALGFGFVEVGSITARPWPGNPLPRLRRFPGDHALVNRMGLPSEGADAVAARLSSRPPFPVWANVAKTGDPSITGDAAVDDICRSVARVLVACDALVLNLSCPNTEDGRTFGEDPDALRELLAAVRRVDGPRRPLLVKVSPDLEPAVLERVAEVSLSSGVRGFVATNTTKGRAGLTTLVPGDAPPGGMSGAPLKPRSLEVVRALRGLVGRGPAIVGCGGIEGASDVTAFLEAGADLVEAYTGFIYQGPMFCREALRAGAVHGAGAER